MQNLKEMFSARPYSTSERVAAPETAEVRAVKETLAQRLHRMTYTSLRLVMVIVAILLPVVFLVSAKWFGMQDSMSAFYLTAMRNVFVGAIFSIGLCLYIYKGYNELENTCLTIAGLFLFGVALAPTTAPADSVNWDLPIVHNVCAVGFFALIAVVCIFARNNGLQKNGEEGAEYDVSFRSTYNITATLMIVVLVVAALLLLLHKVWSIRIPSATFWIETAAVWIFAGYWCVKSRELGSAG